jgi:hypothetical protein
MDGTVRGAMRARLQTAAGQAIYALRKAIVEPVFGQIKEGRGFRRFSFRGFIKVQGGADLPHPQPAEAVPGGVCPRRREGAVRAGGASAWPRARPAR